MPDRLVVRARRQAGVLTRTQVLEAGRSAAWLRWRLADHDWVRVLPGTYVTHTGPLVWRTRAWAAVLYAGPGAALGLGSAGFEHRVVRREPHVVQVVVPSGRKVRDQAWVTVHRRADLATCVVRSSPPRTRVDETVVDLLPSRTDPEAVIGLLCDGLRNGAHPQTLRELLLARPRWRWRGLALPALQECETGIESPLEHRCHRDVLRAHGLPPFDLQVRQKLDGWWIRADARCAAFATRIELDGRLAHPDGRTDDDTWRDNEVVIGTDDRTLRYRWRHVAGHPCLTAGQTAAALRAGGWTGGARRCGPACTVDAPRVSALVGRRVERR